MDTRKRTELRRQEQVSQWREKRQVWFSMPQPAMCAFHYFSKDRSRTAKDLYERWSELTLAGRALYEAQAAPDEARYLAELAEFNARLSLSPSVHSSDGDSEFDSDEYWEYTTDRHQENEERRLMQSWNRYRRDHPKACGGALTPRSCTTIYGMLLSYDVQIRQLEFGQPNLGAWEPIDVRIFAVSRQVQAEALATFYEGNTFLVECRDNWHSYKLPLFIRESSGMSPPWLAERMQRVHVEVGLGKKVASVSVQPQLEQLCNVLKRCKLLELRITVMGANLRHPELDQEFDKLLECFTLVRNVTRVVFLESHSYSLKHRQNYDPIIGTAEQARRLKRIMESKDPVPPE